MESKSTRGGTANPTGDIDAAASLEQVTKVYQSSAKNDAIAFKDIDEGFGQREAMYDTARKIARQFPLFGTGPGTFEAVFQLYRSSEDEYWPVQLHNDWLETLLTFGWSGSALIALAFACALGRWFLPGAIYANWQTTALLWLALAGCLIQARFDFPFQIYSILLLFLLECAILSVVTRFRREG